MPVNSNVKQWTEKVSIWGVQVTSTDTYGSQYVSVNGYSCNQLNATCGVPHRSVLGPLLFIVYINDLPNSSSKLSFYLFTDDTNIYFEPHSLSILQKVVNNTQTCQKVAIC